MNYIPGLGAVRSAQTLKALNKILADAAENFIAHYRTAERFCIEFPMVRRRAKAAYEAVMNLAMAA